MYPGEGITLYDGSAAPDGLRLVHGLRFVVGLSYTFTVLGTSYSQRPYDGETEPLHSHDDMLDKAKRTLLDYAVVLTTDDASEALPIVRHVLRWRPWSLNEVLPVRDRQSGRKRSVVKRNLSSIDRELLMDRNRLDIALYAFARSLVRVDALFWQSGRGRAIQRGRARPQARVLRRRRVDGTTIWQGRAARRFVCRQA